MLTILPIPETSETSVVVIPADPTLVRSSTVKQYRQLRVAAYARVSTDDKEQLSSYESQKQFYTDMINANPAWTLQGIYADEGITGTSTKKRKDFNRMIKACHAQMVSKRAETMPKTVGADARELRFLADAVNPAVYCVEVAAYNEAAAVLCILQQSEEPVNHDRNVASRCAVLIGPLFNAFAVFPRHDSAADIVVSFFKVYIFPLQAHNL